MRNKLGKWSVWAGAILLIYIGLRLPGFAEKMTFHFDQGVHLLESRQMVEDRQIRLIGPMIISKMYLDRGFFLGPQYYYFLGLLGIVFRWDPLIISLFLAFLELIVFAVFSIWVGKTWGRMAGWVTAIFLTISPYLIIHSRFIWNPHIALWLGLFATMLTVYLMKTDSKKGWLGLGVLMGIIFSLHFTMAILLVPIGTVIVKKWRKIKYWGWIIVGGIVGNLPWFVFELRHQFYNTITFFWVMTNSPTKGKMEAHYLFNPFLGMMVVAAAMGMSKIKNPKLRVLAAIIILGVSYAGQMQLYRERIPLGMPQGWDYPTEMKVVDKILAKGCPEEYNVATTNSAVTRAYDLRYLLTIRDCPPMGVEEYPKAKRLFLIAPTARTPDKETVWEVSSLGKFKIIEAEALNPETMYYELGF